MVVEAVEVGPDAHNIADVHEAHHKLEGDLEAWGGRKQSDGETIDEAAEDKEEVE